MADEDHAPQCRMPALRIELVNSILNRLPQPLRGASDGIPCSIRKRPELRMFTDYRDALQVIDQVCPTARAGSRAMDKYDRDLIRPIGLQADELRGRAVEEVAIEKACEFAFPHL